MEVMTTDMQAEHDMWAAFNAEHNTAVERLKGQGVSTAFGIPIGLIPMGTLAEVYGVEVAQPILDSLALSQRNNTLALRELGFFTVTKS